jgi:hypothetical protein
MRQSGRLAGLGVALLAVGGALVYATLRRRWGYYAGTPFSPADLAQISPADRSSLALWWWDTYNNLCGPLPASGRRSRCWPPCAGSGGHPEAHSASEPIGNDQHDELAVWRGHHADCDGRVCRA